MSIRPWRQALLLSTLMSFGAAAAPPPPPDVAVAQLRALNHRFVDAFIDDGHDFMAELIDRDFVRTAGDGAWQGREEFLASFAEPSRMAGASYDQVQVRLFGPVAITQAVFEALMADGRAPRVRYTDVYVWNGRAWRLVSGQNTGLKDGVPAARRTAIAPTNAPWTGQDPTGEDIDVLRQLNEQYVDAFRRADVAWYDAHLAPDYTVVSSDGSLQDRAAALVDFAKPVFAEHIRSFPVDRVRIRRFADVALIHAENAFEMKDGRRGVNRYTDIWVKRDGRWWCVAAHITTHKALK